MLDGYESESSDDGYFTKLTGEEMANLIDSNQHSDQLLKGATMRNKPNKSPDIQHLDSADNNHENNIEEATDLLKNITQFKKNRKKTKSSSKTSRKSLSK